MPDAWPNVFRQSHFLSAVDFVQADRFRRKVAQEMARIFLHVDVLLVPSLRDEILTITNFTGHPALAMMAGLSSGGMPLSVQFVGRFFDEAMLYRVARAWEQASGMDRQHPPI